MLKIRVGGMSEAPQIRRIRPGCKAFLNFVPAPGPAPGEVYLPLPLRRAPPNRRTRQNGPNTDPKRTQNGPKRTLPTTKLRIRSSDHFRTPPKSPPGPPLTPLGPALGSQWVPLGPPETPLDTPGPPQRPPKSSILQKDYKTQWFFNDFYETP